MLFLWLKRIRMADLRLKGQWWGTGREGEQEGRIGVIRLKRSLSSLEGLNLKRHIFQVNHPPKLISKYFPLKFILLH